MHTFFGYQILLVQMISRTLAFLFTVISSAYMQQYPRQQIPSGIQNYTIKTQTIKKMEVHKMQKDNVIAEFNGINYQISSQIYFKKGLISDNDLYNEAAYTSLFEYKSIRPLNGSQKEDTHLSDNPCKIYRTTFKLVNKYRVPLYLRPFRQIFFMPSSKFEFKSKDGPVYTAGYLFINTAQLDKLVAYRLQYKQGQKPLEKLEHSQIKKVDQLKLEDTQSNSTYRYFFRVYENCFIVNGQNLYTFIIHTEKISKIGGYNSHGHQIRGVGSISQNGQNDTVFYVSSSHDIEVYKYNYRNKSVQLQWNCREFIKNLGIVIKSATYDKENKIFYVTSQDSLYILNGDPSQFSENNNTSSQNNNTIFMKAYKLNGTCSFKGKFETTMHLTCRYNKIDYILELFIDKQNVAINRFYTDWDLQGIRDVINIGHEKMILIGDEKFLVQSYAINRHFLMDLGKYQQFDVFPFIDGQFITVVPDFSDEFNTALLKIKQNLIELEVLVQDPAQLYCEFEENQLANKYSVLAVFNTSRCPSQKQENVQGSLQTYCTVKLPFQIQIQKSPLQSKSANLISGSILLLILMGSLLLIGVVIMIVKKIMYSRNAIMKKYEESKNKKLNKYEVQLNDKK